MFYPVIVERLFVGFVSSLVFILFGSMFLPASGAAQTITEIIDSTGDGAGNGLVSPRGVGVDTSDNVYVTAFGSDNVFQITPGGVITEIIDSTGDGMGNGFSRPTDVAVDASGNVYVSRAGISGDSSVFRITPGGVITEIIDSAGDGAGNSLAEPFGIAVGASGNVYVSGFRSDNVFQITPGGVITEIIDSTGDGAGNLLGLAQGVAVDPSGNVYVVGVRSDNVFQITAGGVVTEIIDATGDGAGNLLSAPRYVAVDASGNVYVTGADSNNAFLITPGGVIREIIASTIDGVDIPFDTPFGVAVDGSDNVYVAAVGSDNVFQITPGGVIREIIDSSGDGAGNLFDSPWGVGADASGNVYVTGADSDNVFQITLLTPPLFPVACPAMPEPACLEAVRAKLKYSEKRSGKENMKMQWKKITSITTQSDFGDPVIEFTSVALCIYDDGDGLVQDFVIDRAGQFCPRGRCWKARGDRGYQYGDRNWSADGISKINYLSGAASKGKAAAGGRNELLKGQLSLPLGVVSKLTGNIAPTIQMLTSDGFCVGARMTDVRKDDGLFYKARFK